MPSPATQSVLQAPLTSIVAFAQLFAPLSFLGSIYGAIVDAFEDMRNLTDLLRTVHAIAYSPLPALTCSL